MLAGKLKDAVNVCIKQLNDPQLAVCLCRIYEGESGPVLLDILINQLIPEACKSGDRWLSVMLWTLANNTENAFKSITCPLGSLLVNPSHENGVLATMDPSLLLLLKHLQVSYKKLIMQTIPTLSATEEAHFIAECVRSYDRLGFPTLALQLLTQQQLDVLPEVQIIQENHTQEISNHNTAKHTASTLDWNAPAEPAISSGLDWGELETKTETTAGGIDWGELESKPTPGGLDWGELETQPKTGGLDWGELETSAKLDSNDELETGAEEEKMKSEDVTQSNTAISVTEIEFFKMKVQHIDLNVYKRFLIMRILHVF